jgi:hypothetical protein
VRLQFDPARFNVVETVMLQHVAPAPTET